MRVPYSFYELFPIKTFLVLLRYYKSIVPKYNGFQVYPQTTNIKLNSASALDPVQI